MNRIIKNWCDRQIAKAGIYPGKNITINNEEIYWRVLRNGSLAVGEGYVDSSWDTDNLDEIIAQIFSSGLQNHRVNQSAAPLIAAKVGQFLLNQQTKIRAKVVGEKHYDVGNDLYERMLDKRMVYTCAYWKGANTLDQAQENKLDLVCRKLQLQPGMKVLDLGCGFGSLAKYMAEKYDVQVVGVTISREQQKYGQDSCQGLPVEIRFQDYRDVNEQFDRVSAVGILEHVGSKNYPDFFRTVRRCLKADGLCLAHTIGRKVTSTVVDPWIDRYVFPGGTLPSVSQIAAAVEGLFVVEDIHNIGIHYDKTLMCWHKNFVSAWDDLKHNYDADFYRVWEYYLLSCAGAFRSRHHQVFQFVLSPNGVPGGYESIR